VAAARLAEVVAAHPDPLEVRGRGQHLPQQLAIGGLGPGALAQRQARLGNAVGERVAQSLQLAQVEHPWLDRDRGDAMLDHDPAEALGQERGELTLEPADLASQLGPGQALVGLDVECHRALSCEQIGHRLPSSVDHRSVAAAIQSASSTAICGTPLT